MERIIPGNTLWGWMILADFYNAGNVTNFSLYRAVKP
jgi:hypothetical protein